MSTWHHFNGVRAKAYYLYFPALFICDGVLFENFVTEGVEKDFSDKIV
jgi:hypothetical protein